MGAVSGITLDAVKVLSSARLRSTFVMGALVLSDSDHLLTNAIHISAEAPMSTYSNWLLENILLRRVSIIITKKIINDTIISN